MPQLDIHFPDCGCEQHSLRALGGNAVADDEMIARIITSPIDYDIASSILITPKLTSVYSVGLSVIRTGASDEEIFSTLQQMLDRQAESQTLVGAIVVNVNDIRKIADGERWFGVYATDAGIKDHHADIAGTFPRGLSNTKEKNTRNQRRYRLGKLLAENLMRVNSGDQLLQRLREKGI